MPATLICIGMFLIHLVIMFRHPHQMRSHSTDQPGDPLYTPHKVFLAFTLTTVIQAIGLYRRILIAFDLWETASPFHQWLDFLPLPANTDTLMTGSILFGSGLLLRLWSIRTLGHFFTYEIGIRSRHTIITKGPYRWIRHPSYTGYLLLIVGIAVAYASLFCVLLAVTFPGLFFIHRIKAEEAMLLKHFGEPYRQYMKKTKRLLPQIY